MKKQIPFFSSPSLKVWWSSNIPYSNSSYKINTKQTNIITKTKL